MSNFFRKYFGNGSEQYSESVDVYREALLVRKKSNFLLYVFVCICIILSVILFFVMYREPKKTNNLTEVATSQELSGDIGDLLSEVGMHIVLPEDPDVTIATVTNPAELQSQAFFRNAITGDKVLIWANTRKAILYRPSIKKIIEVTSVEVVSP